MWIKAFGIFMRNFYHSNYNNFVNKSKSCEHIRITSRDVGCLYSNASFDFGADQNHEMNPGSLTDFLPLWNSSDCTIFAYKYVNIV